MQPQIWQLLCKSDGNRELLFLRHCEVYSSLPLQGLLCGTALFCHFPCLDVANVCMVWAAAACFHTLGKTHMIANWHIYFSCVWTMSDTNLLPLWAGSWSKSQSLWIRVFSFFCVIGWLTKIPWFWPLYPSDLFFGQRDQPLENLFHVLIFERKTDVRVIVVACEEVWPHCQSNSKTFPVRVRCHLRFLLSLRRHLAPCISAPTSDLSCGSLPSPSGLTSVWLHGSEATVTVLSASVREPERGMNGGTTHTCECLEKNPETKLWAQIVGAKLMWLQQQTCHCSNQFDQILWLCLSGSCLWNCCTEHKSAFEFQLSFNFYSSQSGEQHYYMQG